ncbi:hypothetical protein BT96DRAFT_720250 [Gymnopus androsaceus JB14]|uniref:Uncharacterized protein n=1 Tax=Gymnopus androsaceus JB14 TaxID=1447944 RepID=A0A6A4HMY3_9AGAR|nr:hypothetical protein BT96DRAFT_720250 [Gymnopus androsaceus JB14]
MSAPPSPELDNLSCHSRQTSQNSDSSAESTASIQSLHLASVPLSSFRTPVSPPSSRSAHSTQTSPISAATSYRVYRRDDNATEHGSNLGAGEVAGLMRTLNLNSSPTIERDLEDGEIRERVPRQRQQSFGGALPSSPEVLPTKNAITTLPTCSTLSTIPSSSSFQSSSSSIPTSVSNSSDMSPRAKVPETGPIDLEALEKDSDALPKFSLNPNAPAHIPSSGDSCTSYDTNDDQFKSPNVYINGLPPHYPGRPAFRALLSIRRDPKREELYETCWREGERLWVCTV